MNEFYKSPDYFEKEIYHFWRPIDVNKCKDCLCVPEVFSLREGKEESYVRLLGIKITCPKCKKFIMKEHNQYRQTMHPDDATIGIVVEEWNKRNE